ncbi:MAG: hypothetical protein CMO01_00445 [Thalassobius sp.]|nr:hypothetical protein [Thalassovita sp.]
MKKLIALFTFLSFASLMYGQDYIINADERPDTDMSEYKTYGWASHIIDETTASFSLNNLVLKNQIKTTVENEMAGLGYEKSTKPDLMLGFVVFDKPTEFKGYGSMKDDDYYYDYWYGFGREELGESETYNFEPGSIVIHMVDTKTGDVVWQGYASGVMDNNVFDLKPDNVEEAVQLIFEEFDYRADDFKSTGR